MLILLILLIKHFCNSTRLKKKKIKFTAKYFIVHTLRVRRVHNVGGG